MKLYKNKLAYHTDIMQKFRDYNRDRRNGALAYRSDDTAIPLSDAKLSTVEFIGGLWRVQDEFPYKIQTVRNREMVLLKQLPHQEHTLFEYYTASTVGYNCYGPFLSGNSNYIVAKYVTDDGIYWGYGTSIESARAFLGIKLYDQYMDLIHTHACKRILSRQKK